MHEASLYTDNCFITLTYNSLWMPDDGSLSVRHWQLFMKRLNKRFGPGIRFYHCGEYGENFSRPHYHACLFGFDFPDKYLWRRSPRGDLIWRSPALEELWPYGYSEIGSVTFESAAYVARYIMKKITGKLADDHYFDPYTGVYRRPEYVTMSRRPGIGRDWFEKFKGDVYPSDSVVYKGKEMRPPRYYDKLFDALDPQDMEVLKHDREMNAMKYVDECTTDRLRVREQVEIARLSQLKRSL